MTAGRVGAETGEAGGLRRQVMLIGKLGDNGEFVAMTTMIEKLYVERSIEHSIHPNAPSNRLVEFAFEDFDRTIRTRHMLVAVGRAMASHAAGRKKMIKRTCV